MPGAIGRVAELHAVYGHRQWKLGAFFEAKVAAELAELWSGMTIGATGSGQPAVTGASRDRSRWRWCSVAGTATRASICGPSRACARPEKAGFVLSEERRGTQWGTEVTEQRFDYWKA